MKWNTESKAKECHKSICSIKIISKYIIWAIFYHAISYWLYSIASFTSPAMVIFLLQFDINAVTYTHSEFSGAWQIFLPIGINSTQINVTFSRRMTCCLAKYITNRVMREKNCIYQQHEQKKSTGGIGVRLICDRAGSRCHCKFFI